MTRPAGRVRRLSELRGSSPIRSGGGLNSRGSGRVGSGRVGSGQEVFKSHGPGRVKIGSGGFQHLAGGFRLGQEVFEISRAGSVRIRSFPSLMGGVWSGRVWSGRVGSGRVEVTRGRVKLTEPEVTRPDPREVTRPVKSRGKNESLLVCKRLV